MIHRVEDDVVAVIVCISLLLLVVDVVVVVGRNDLAVTPIITPPDRSGGLSKLPSLTSLKCKI